MRKITIALFFSCTLILFASAFAFAQAVYVVDEFEITMRTGPSSDRKILAMLRTGTRLEVIEEKEGWYLVRGPADKEGWVLKRYVSTETPKKTVIKQLQKKLDLLSDNSTTATEKINMFEKENREMRSILDSTQVELAKVKREYSSLVTDSKNVLALKKEHTENVDNLKTVTSELQQIREENMGLRADSRIKWFLSGGGVVFISWLFGYFMGKSKKRSRTHSLYT